MKHLAVNSKLAAKVGIVHLEELETLNELGDAIDNAVAKVMRQLLGTSNFQHALQIASTLNAAVAEAIEKTLASVVVRRYTRLSGQIIKTLPKEYQTMLAGVPVETLVKEEKGQVQFGFTGGSLSRKRQREPVINTPDEEAKRQALERLVFKPLSLERIAGIIYAGGSQEAFRRITGLTALADPAQLASKVIRSTYQGKTRAEIAGELEPMLRGVRSSARRLARTEGARVSNESNMQTFEAMGDLVIGYQIHAVVDHRSRPWHAQRNGRIYYKQPTQGQDGLDKMPRPPNEPADPRERPAGEPQTAGNCRCYLSPVMRPLEKVSPEQEQLFRNAERKVIPDPETYDQWFAGASTKQQKQAVGAARFNLVEDLLGRQPEWTDFLNPHTGLLMGINQLRKESPSARTERKTLARTTIARQSQAKRRVLSRTFR